MYNIVMSLAIRYCDSLAKLSRMEYEETVAGSFSVHFTTSILICGGSTPSDLQIPSVAELIIATFRFDRGPHFGSPDELVPFCVTPCR